MVAAHLGSAWEHALSPMLDTASLRKQPTAMQQLQATPCPPGMVNLALKFRLAEAEALLKHERWVSGNLQDQVDSLKVQVGGLAWLPL